MKRFLVVALSDVGEDIQLAYDYFASWSASAGERFLGRYFQTIDRISLNAESFSIKFDDYRRAIVPRSNFAIYYFIGAEKIVVVAVIDARRHPRLIRNLVRGRQ